MGPIFPIMKTLIVVLVVLGACREPAAPAEKPCVPDFNNPDSSKTLTYTADSVPVIRIAWCGPITVV